MVNDNVYHTLFWRGRNRRPRNNRLICLGVLMRKTIPHNNVSYDYEKIIKEFMSHLMQELDNELVLV